MRSLWWLKPINNILTFFSPIMTYTSKIQPYYSSRFCKTSVYFFANCMVIKIYKVIRSETYGCICFWSWLSPHFKIIWCSTTCLDKLENLKRTTMTRGVACIFFTEYVPLKILIKVRVAWGVWEFLFLLGARKCHFQRFPGNSFINQNMKNA